MTQTEHIEKLQKHGFNVVMDGGDAVIVIGKRDQIPIDRPVGALDLLGDTRARRFDSAGDAVRVLVEQRGRKEAA